MNNQVPNTNPSLSEMCKCGHNRNWHSLSSSEWIPSASGCMCGDNCDCKRFKIAAVFEVDGGTQTEEKLTDVYEVYGSCATGRGWDFMVCMTMKEALEHIEDSMDSLEPGEEVKIVFQRYTAIQMEDVVYE